MDIKSVKFTLTRSMRFTLYKLKKENKLQEIITKGLENIFKESFGRLPDYQSELENIQKRG